MRTGKPRALVLFALTLLSFLLSASGVDAAVTLLPRVNQAGAILKDDGGKTMANEDYVIFGRVRHRLAAWDGARETAPQPVLWRVMSLDPTTSPNKATLLSHYIVDAMKYSTDNDSSWAASDVRTWLNGAFLADFSAVEKNPNVMLPGSDGLNSQVTLPSGEADDSSGTPETWRYRDGDIRAWFGDNDSNTAKTNTNARKAHYKGAAFRYGTSDSGAYYWTRSPVMGRPGFVWFVRSAGMLFLYDVDYPRIGLRPVFTLNLESVLFKSASVPGGASVGGPSNPYLLYLTANAGADVAPVSGTGTGRTLTLAFGGRLFHAYKNRGSGIGLAAKFEVAKAGTPVSGPVDATLDGSALTLTFDEPLEPGATYTVGYRALNANDTDGLGVLDGDIPRAVGTMGGGKPIAVVVK